MLLQGLSETWAPMLWPVTCTLKKVEGTHAELVAHPITTPWLVTTGGTEQTRWVNHHSSIEDDAIFNSDIDITGSTAANPSGWCFLNIQTFHSIWQMKLSEPCKIRPFVSLGGKTVWLRFCSFLYSAWLSSAEKKTDLLLPVMTRFSFPRPPTVRLLEEWMVPMSDTCLNSSRSLSWNSMLSQPLGQMPITAQMTSSMNRLMTPKINKKIITQIAKLPFLVLKLVLWRQYSSTGIYTALKSLLCSLLTFLLSTAFAHTNFSTSTQTCCSVTVLPCSRHCGPQMPPFWPTGPLTLHFYKTSVGWGFFIPLKNLIQTSKLIYYCLSDLESSTTLISIIMSCLLRMNMNI